ncbi:hypothetical protein K0M31_011226 [Melipona bicolor]|uniref:Uncharacterized protein n=1 Tax=Melipona bicolor TaxID=60889 RepID=A0AA40KUP3_9HYME|nr:hypothetical protein K0M31_011226 [Melipona bicolor]
MQRFVGAIKKGTSVSAAGRSHTCELGHGMVGAMLEPRNFKNDNRPLCGRGGHSGALRNGGVPSKTLDGNARNDRRPAVCNHHVMLSLGIPEQRDRLLLAGDTC